ncbi:Factor of DNA methylation 1 [Spatholobus suberectus]|nr:Factor of DNA methylation 1 [Spatholobus suberectus]
MASSSDEESDISESEKEDYKEKSYDQLKAGKYKIKNANATLRCPFCEGKKKQTFQFKDLLQHAFGIGRGSSKRRVKVKAKHLALAQYLKEDLSNELENNSQGKPHELEIAIEQPNPDERFVWPWTVIVADIFGKPKDESEECDSKHWLRKFELYKPKEAHVLHSAEDPRGYVVLEFGTEWTGFRQVMKLDTDFLADNHGKKDYESRKMGPASGLYAWCAREEDYNSEGLVGTYLRQKAELKTTSKVVQDAWKEKSETVVHLLGEIGHANQKIGEMETKYTEHNMSLNKMMEERDLLHQTRVEEMRLMQKRAREHSCRVMEETENLQHDINTRSAELDRWCQQLIEQETSTIHERRKFEEEKKRKMESLILASEEQVKAKCDFVSLLEKHQMEKKTQSDALLKLEKEMDNEHKLKLEIAELEGQLKVLKCMNVVGADHEKSRKKEIQEMEEKLEDMIFDMSVKDDENRALEKKEQLAKTELEDARQELVRELPRVLKGCTNIGVKKFGEISAKPFQKVCKNRYKDNKKASLESAKLQAKWQNEILDSTWHPFRIVEVEGKEKQEVIDENDPKLSSLKKDLGEEAYVAVLTALKELHEYHNSNHGEMNLNSSGKSVIPEVWNFKTERRATLVEALNYIMNRVIKMR